MPTIMTPQGPVQLPYPGGGPGGPPMGPGGPPGPPGGSAGPGMGPGGPGPGGPGAPADILREIITRLQEYMDAEQDDEDLAVGAKLIAQAQQLLAKQQRERDQAIGAGPSVKMMRRMQGGA